MYLRMIAYLNVYRNKEKGANCGYIRLYVHDEECRMEMNVTDVPWRGKDIRICMFWQENGEYQWREVLKEKVDSEVIRLKHICICESLTGENDVKQAKGMLLFDGEDMMKAVCGTFDGEEVMVGEICEKIREDSERKLEHPADLKKMDESETSVYEYDEECLRNKQNGEENCIRGVSAEETGEEIRGMENETEGTGQDHVLKPQEQKCLKWQEKMFHVFPKVMVRMNGEETCGIRLKPHDLVWMPGCYWRLASNRFLLDGYYHYRYLLFFRIKDAQEEKYFIGAPGCFGLNNAMMAKKYGFTDFFSAGGCQGEAHMFAGAEETNFGFWCKALV